jgi:hypothetical protein
VITNFSLIPASVLKRTSDSENSGITFIKLILRKRQKE